MYEQGITYTVQEIRAMADRRAAWERAKLAVALTEAADKLVTTGDKPE